MSVANDGGPAFPGAHLDRDVLELLRNTPANFGLQEAARLASHHGGMTLRDYFAAKAMQSIILKLELAVVTVDLPEEARKAKIEAIKASYMPAAAAGAYTYADAMLAERSKGGAL